MRFYLCIFVISIVESNNSRKYCDLLLIDSTKHCFVQETLASMSHSPNQFAVDQASNRLYFSFDIGQGDYAPVVLNMKTKTLNILKGVKDAFAIANDKATESMYFGGSYGIYKYNSNNKILKRLNIKNLDIWWLFIRENIYFIKFPSLTAYYYTNKTIKPVKELENTTVHQFVFDKDNNIFFINSTGLYGVKSGENRPILLRDRPKFVGMATDSSGNVYVCSDDGIYVVKKLVQKVKKLINLAGVLGIAFDKDNNIIYTNSYDIIRLIPVYNISNSGSGL